MKDPDLYKAYIKRNSVYIPRIVIIVRQYEIKQFGASHWAITITKSEEAGSVRIQRNSPVYIKIYELL